ncbi:hypothetical protein WJX73_007567 [Symbiochloris irregularis]|uniref:Uncharacterized protein n=1 Tax=Symbiochloris irregularis TaxID=706552 RepID=A0AAW1PNB5_9CHLO
MLSVAGANLAGAAEYSSAKMSAFMVDDGTALVDIPGIASLDTFFQEGLQAFTFSAIQESAGTSSAHPVVRSDSATSSTGADQLLQEDAARSGSLPAVAFLPSMSWPSSDAFTDSAGGSPRCLATADVGSDLAAAGSSELASEPQVMVLPCHF